MSLENIKNAIPDYAKDIRLNVSGLANDETLSPVQFWGCVVACAMAAENAFVLREVMKEAPQTLDEAAITAAKSAAAIMAMNNVYYKFIGSANNAVYKTMPAKLRMNVIADPGVDKGDFELWSLAVSAMNGCKYCVDAHEAQLNQHGIDAPKIQAAVRIAAIIKAAANVLTTEEALQTVPGAVAKAA